MPKHKSQIPPGSKPPKDWTSYEIHALLAAVQAYKGDDKEGFIERRGVSWGTYRNWRDLVAEGTAVPVPPAKRGPRRSNDEKARIVAEYRRIANGRVIAKKYGINASTIYEWNKVFGAPLSTKPVDVSPPPQPEPPPEPEDRARPRPTLRTVVRRALFVMAEAVEAAGRRAATRMRVDEEQRPSRSEEQG